MDENLDVFSQVRCCINDVQTATYGHVGGAKKMPDGPIDGIGMVASLYYKPNSPCRPVHSYVNGNPLTKTTISRN